MSQDCGYARKRAEEETRMNKIYAWYPSMNGGLSTGHASLDISFGQGAPLADYVSWWPTRDVKRFADLYAALAAALCSPRVLAK